MRLVTGWVEARSGRLVSIDTNVVKTVTSFRQTAPHDTEAGGLLLGLRRGPHIEVKWLTVPQDSDTRGRFGFVREKLGHAAQALARWYATRSKTDYVGEWHTHPEPYPTPSGTDVSEWVRLASARVDGRPLVFLIVGTEDFYACLCQGNEVYRMTPIESK